MTDFIIVNAEGILTGLAGGEARTSGNVRVRGGRIDSIGALSPESGERVVDASGCVVAPGLVNTHHHLFQSVLNSVPAGLKEALAAWLRLVPYTHWDRLTGPALKTAARIGIAELVLSGATTIADHHYFYSDLYDFDPGEILFGAAEEFGVRFVLARGGATKARRFDSNDITPLPTEPLEAMIASVGRDAKRWHDPAPDAMRRVVMAPTTPTFSLHERELRELAAAARAMGVRLHSHLSENMDYVTYTLENFGKRPVEWLAGHDWLGPDVWFAHLVECDEAEVRLLAETGTGMAHCPQANARLGSGIAPADLLHELGGTVSLAVDGAAANEAADMGSALYSAFLLHRAAKGVGAVMPETVLHWATAGGARVLGLDATGSLEPGKAADIAVFDLSEPRCLGQHDQMVSPVISGGAKVRHSFVAGRTIVENGRIPWLDMAELAEDAKIAVDGMRTGRSPGTVRSVA